MKKILTIIFMAILLCGCRLQSNCDCGYSQWQNLFNGKDLTGWQIKCLPKDQNKTFWQVKNGYIECDSIGKGQHDYVWLMSRQEYDDFHLSIRFQVFASCKGNSGLQFRSRYDDTAGWLNGPQIDIHPPAPFRTGLIYDETKGVTRWICPSMKSWQIQPIQAPPAARQTTLNYADNDPDAWNTLELICDGMKIQTFVNNRLICDYDAAGILDDQNHKTRNVGSKGHLALQLHSQDELIIRFKDIHIRQKRK